MQITFLCFRQWFSQYVWFHLPSQRNELGGEQYIFIDLSWLKIWFCRKFHVELKMQSYWKWIFNILKLFYKTQLRELDQQIMSDLCCVDSMFFILCIFCSITSSIQTWHVTLLSLQLQSCCKAESSWLMRIKQNDSNCIPGMVTMWTLWLWIGEISKNMLLCISLLLRTSFFKFFIFCFVSLWSFFNKYILKM